jgi:virulence-associated protein VapD
MYAITFDLDTNQLQQQYPNPSWQNAYNDIKKVLLPLGFKWQQGSVYFGDETMNAVRCVLAVQQLSCVGWVAAVGNPTSTRRIEPLNDKPASD